MLNFQWVGRPIEISRPAHTIKKFHMFFNVLLDECHRCVQIATCGLKIS